MAISAMCGDLVVESATTGGESVTSSLYLLVGGGT
jgi:hypothetical protein